MILSLERKLLAIVTVILCFLGVLFVYESSAMESFALSGNAYHFALTQFAGMAVGLVVLVIASYVNANFYFKYPYLFYVLGLVFLGLCFWNGIPPFIRGNEVILGARRWIWIMGVSVQVAEIVKICTVIFFAYLLLKTKQVWVFVLYLAPIAGLVLLQKDLGSLLVIFAIAVGQFFLSGAPMKKLIPFGLGLVGAIILMIILSPYRRERLMTYFDPTADTQDDTYHIDQLLIAIGRGGIMGKGIGGSIQKYHVPEASSDSIFSIVAEEIGFVGVSIVLLLYFLFLYLLFRIVRLGTRGESSKLMGYGIFLLFFSQIFINLGAISGLTPLTGITLPFFSAGGSSMVISLFLVGVVLGLTRHPSSDTIRKRKYG